MAGSGTTTRWVVTLAAAVLLTACTTSESGSGSAGFTAATSSKTAAARPLAIYYVADIAVGPRLYREFHSAPAVPEQVNPALVRFCQRAFARA